LVFFQLYSPTVSSMRRRSIYAGSPINKIRLIKAFSNLDKPYFHFVIRLHGETYAQFTNRYSRCLK